MSTTPDPQEPTPGGYPPPPPPATTPSSGQQHDEHQHDEHQHGTDAGTPPRAEHGAGPGGYPPPSAYGASTPLSPADQRTWAVVSHLGGVFVSFIVPLVIWLVFRGRGAYLEDQAKESLNFQITLFLGYLIGTITVIILLGFFILPLVWLFGVVFSIIAAVASSRGEPYRYPLTLRLIT
ncbi:DUF4870 domain-containing protein [uncultured Cellulomonas sp.]|uniref:DUF4870 domain-containing protein n=1 Tax=uncultured Cellulomonas sp. TaxID=189682 RepID=UPI00261CE3F4|nr:DUF4870 domain-containing protein [uncultured Cellulomonas sp.]